MRTVRCAMGQLYVEGGRPDRNLARAEALIARAAAERADVIVLPECMDLGWTHPSALELAQPIPDGASCGRLAAAARAHGIHIVAGLVEADGPRRYNAVVLLDPEGRLIGHSRKINELTIAHPYYAIGDRLCVAHAAFGDVGLNICADNFANALEIGDVLCRMGARLILSPSSWADDAEGKEHYAYNVGFWVENYRRLARHYGIGVVAVSNVGQLTAGPWAGKQVVGCSVAVGPDGNVLAQCRTGWDENAEELRVVELPVTPQQARGTDVRGLFSA